MKVDERRVRALNTKPAGTGPVLYLMSRDQRVQDNWALLYAKQTADERKAPLIVAFCVTRISARANLRQYEFMLAGLALIEIELRRLNIPFVLLEGLASRVVPGFVQSYEVGEVVTDFSPLRFARKNRENIAKKVLVLMTEVDAHNIVPCWLASDKQEFAAYTFRPKIKRALAEFLVPFPLLTPHQHDINVQITKPDFVAAGKKLSLDESVSRIKSIPPGSALALARLSLFIEHSLERYHIDRNDPTLEGVSGLSPYLHFGQLSAQRVALQVQSAKVSRDAREAFLEELIVRRELADNYCFYNLDYDKVSGAHSWAQKSILEHKNDVREYRYSKAQFEAGETHDDLWNAMQRQMVWEGKMHGWCRMYWAKKILEWTPDVQTAIDIALYLNDKYELDGNDPNGYVGVMWSLCGLHDRAWNERNIFGKVRFMNYAGAKRKFDIKSYIMRYEKKNTLFE